MNKDSDSGIDLSKIDRDQDGKISGDQLVNIGKAIQKQTTQGVTWFRQGKDDVSCKAVWVGTVKIPKQ